MNALYFSSMLYNLYYNLFKNVKFIFYLLSIFEVLFFLLKNSKVRTRMALYMLYVDHFVYTLSCIYVTTYLMELFSKQHSVWLYLPADYFWV